MDSPVSYFYILSFVGKVGFEPTTLAGVVFETTAYAGSATRPFMP